MQASDQHCCRGEWQLLQSLKASSLTLSLTLWDGNNFSQCVLCPVHAGLRLGKTNPVSIQLDLELRLLSNTSSFGLKMGSFIWRLSKCAASDYDSFAVLCFKNNSAYATFFLSLDTILPHLLFWFGRHYGSVIIVVESTQWLVTVVVGHYCGQPSLWSTIIVLQSSSNFVHCSTSMIPSDTIPLSLRLKIS